MSILSRLKGEKPAAAHSRNFYEIMYQQHNIARLSHLHSLGLDLDNKNVLELGAGTGDHTLFYLYRSCTVLPIEGREELCELIQNRFGIPAKKVDFETESALLDGYRNYEVVHCYGLLYHLSNPEEFLQHACRTGKLFLLETCVSTDDSPDPINLINESLQDATQAISGKGCRPVRQWIYDELSKYFKHVYCPVTQPKHEEFPTDLRKKLPGDRLTRAIFVASETELHNPLLVKAVPETYRK